MMYSMYFLCKDCNRDFDNYFTQTSPAKCYRCKGKINKVLKEVERFLKNNKMKGKYFSLSIIFDKRTLVREENLFDIKLGKSIKFSLSRRIKESIEKNEMKYSPINGDFKISIDFDKVKLDYDYENLYIYGAYSKLKQWISQKRWKKFNKSVEQIIGDFLNKKTQADGYVMHSSGREDVDAINTGFRPFVFELTKAKKRYFGDVKEMEIEFNKKNKDVKVKLYGKVPPSFVSLVSDSHFDKEYRAYIEGEIRLDELKKLEELKNFVVVQKTPLRVLTRRKDKYRKRRVYSISFGEDNKGVYMDIKCEAGLYIKEFISGDKGRTNPSLSKLTGKKLKCSFLIVKNINYSFLNHVFKYVGLQH